MQTKSVTGWLAALWGVAGVCTLLGYAIHSMSGYVVIAMDDSLRWYHWLSLVLFTLFMAYSEGYRGFQQGFAPRVAARARYLQRTPDAPWPVLVFAPAFCASYIYSTPRRRLVVVLLTTMIVSLVLLVRMLPQPWRGIVDLGVVVGLAWGIASILLFSVRALLQSSFEFSAELPENLQREPELS